MTSTVTTACPAGAPPVRRRRPRRLGGRWRAIVFLLASAVLAPSCTSTSTAPGGDTTPAARRTDVSVYPLPGTVTASPGTEISFRNVDPVRVKGISVVGTLSGEHTGSVVRHSDGRGASFVPSAAFTPGERVTVDAGGLELAASPSRFEFAIAQPVTEAVPPPSTPPDDPKGVRSYVSRPDLRPAALTVERSAPGTAAGLLFLAPKHGASQAGVMIAADDGSPVWFRPSAPDKEAQDFRVQRYQGAPVLTWWEGDGISGHGTGRYLIYDTSYREVASFAAGNGMPGDFHEFQLTERGTALITIYNPVRIETDLFGGHDGVREALDSVVQELDVATGRVLFEWHSLGAVGLDEAYNEPDPEHKRPYDHFHINSIDEDADGNCVISARNTRAIYKIARQTGEIVWRLGGKQSDFSMGPGTEMAYQHDARVRPGGVLTLFDNGGAPRVSEESRGLVIALDEVAKTATLLRAYTQPGKLAANSQGNMQVLDNGNVFIGWGQQPYMSEFTADGKPVFTVRLPERTQTYRAFRFAWDPKPTDRPAVAIQPAGDGTATVYASWNGATGVAGWRLLVGPDSNTLAPAGLDQPSQGFETSLPYSGAAGVVAVAAVGATGRVIATSPPVRWTGSPARS